MPDDTQPVAPQVNVPLDPSMLEQVLSDAGGQQPKLAQPKSASLPTVGRLVADLIKPPMTAEPGQLARPQSRMDAFERFLGDFVGALGQGFSAAGKGSTPGQQFGLGAGGAINAPQTLARQQAETGLIQSQVESEQAGAKQKEAQTKLLQANVPVTLPNGQQVLIPANQIGQYLRGGAAAQTSGAARIESAQIGAAAKLGVAQLQVAVANGTASKFLPDVDAQGQPFYHVMNKFGREIGRADTNVIPSLQQRTSNTQQWVQDQNGQWTALPKSTTTGPAVLKGAGAKTAAPVTNGTGPVSSVPKITGAAPAKQSGVFGKSAAESGRAFDPQSQEWVQANRADAAQRGLQNFTPVTDAGWQKYATSQRQFNDVQMNVSRYRSAVQQYAAKENMADEARINTIINKVGAFDLKVRIAAGGDVEIPGLSAALEAASRETRSVAFNGLSPEGKDMVNGYFRALASVPAYVKGLTGVGRWNKETIDLELANMPNPTLAPKDQIGKLQAFQENIDRAVEGLPRMPGLSTTKDIRRQFEPQAQPGQVNPQLRNIINQGVMR